MHPLLLKEQFISKNRNDDTDLKEPPFNKVSVPNKVLTSINSNSNHCVINASNVSSKQDCGDMLTEKSSLSSQQRNFPTLSPFPYCEPSFWIFLTSDQQTMMPFPHFQENERYEHGASLNPRYFSTAGGTNNKKDLFSKQLRPGQDRKNECEGMTWPIPHWSLVRQLSDSGGFLPVSRPRHSEFSQASSTTGRAPNKNIDTIPHGHKSQPICHYDISAGQAFPHQKNISGKHNNTEADEVLSSCIGVASVATPLSPFACTTKGYAHSDHLHKFQPDSRRHPKAQNYINSEKQELQSEPTHNIQEHQVKHNPVTVVCSAKPNKGEQNLDGLEYDHNRTVNTSSALKSSLSSISPFVPDAFSREGIPMVWVCNICGMVAFRSQFEASAHELKCNASSQYTNPSTGDPSCRNRTDGYRVARKPKSPAVTHSLHGGEKETSAGPRKIMDLDNRTRWEARYKQLSEYKKRCGTCCVPQFYPEDPGLGLWVKVQRRSFRLHSAGKKNPLLSGQRLEKLESLGFVWDAPLNVRYSSRWKDKKFPRAQPKSWDVRFQQLKLFQERYNHCRVPQRYPELGFWVKTQRMLYRKMINGKKSSMTKKAAQTLESIGFEWRLSTERKAVPSCEKNRAW